VRIDADTRRFFDQLAAEYGCETDAELLRVLLAVTLLHGTPVAARAAAALYSSATTEASRSASVFVAHLRDELAVLAADVVAADRRPRVAGTGERPPGQPDPTRVQTTLDTLLHGRLEALVRYYEAYRAGTAEEPASPIERALLAYLHNNPHLVSTRYPLAETLRWLLAVRAPADPALAPILETYRTSKRIMTAVIDRAFSAARIAATDGIAQVREDLRRRSA